MKKEFDTIKGYESIKKELELFCDILTDTEKYKKLGVETPKGLILVGSPGTGKTTMAKALIKASGRKAYTIRKNRPDGSFVEKIAQTFEEAKKNAPSIVFLDDFDKFSNGDDEHCNTDEFVTVQASIDDVKDYEVFVLATANDIRDLPGSLLRNGRFDKTICVNNPDLEDSKLIIKHYLSKKKNVGDVDIDLIAGIMQDKSCADLETVVNEAGLIAGFTNNAKITNDDIITACLKVIFDVNNVEDKSEYFKKVAAVHECGHAIASELLEPKSVNLVSIGNYLGDNGGITSINMNKDYFVDMKFMENRVIILLAGKAATEVILNMYDTGANSDIQRAIRVVERFVDNYACFGFDKFERRNSGDALINAKENNITLLMEIFYKKAKDIIFDNKDLLNKMVDLLLEKSYLTNVDIKKLMPARA